MKKLTQPRSLLAYFACALCAPATLAAQTFDERALLDRVISHSYTGHDQVSLTRAIKALSGHSLDTFIDFGIELDSDEAHQPTVSMHLDEGLTVRQALERVLVQAPGYDYQVKSRHFISIAPRRLREDTTDILNLKVAKFDVENAQSGEILAWPETVIPELRRLLFSDEGSRRQVVQAYVGTGIAVGPLITLHLRDTTVREISDAVSIETETGALKDGLPLGWVFSMEHPKGSPPQPKWQLIGTAPGNWKQLRSEASRAKP